LCPTGQAAPSTAAARKVIVISAIRRQRRAAHDRYNIAAVIAGLEDNAVKK
jgi:hypothetical protein